MLMIASTTHFKFIKSKTFFSFGRPYSPDLNPIEYAFSLAKALLKRNRHVTRINPKYCMARALEEVSSPSFDY